MVQVGAHARLMSQALRKINVNAARAGVTIIFLNQLRSKVGVIYGNPEITTGGNALKFYASVRLDIRRREVIKGKAGAEDEGTRVKVKVAKNKVAPPYRVAEFDMLFGRGISKLGCLLDAADEMAVVERRGSWYSYGEERLGQGREKAVEYLTENPAVLEAVESDVRRLIAEKLAGKYGAPIDKKEGVEELKAFAKDSPFDPPRAEESASRSSRTIPGRADGDASRRRRRRRDGRTFFPKEEGRRAKSRVRERVCCNFMTETPVSMIFPQSL